jgi:MgtC family
MLSWNDFLLRLGAAVLGGALIGFERQWRSRGAGLRTNTLVAAGAAMFVLIAQMTPSHTGFDLTRITSYVVSGVGFLGAGVIISDGARVRGINTAATLWCAAAERPAPTTRATAENMAAIPTMKGHALIASYPTRRLAFRGRVGSASIVEVTL